MSDFKSPPLEHAEAKQFSDADEHQPEPADENADYDAEQAEQRRKVNRSPTAQIVFGYQLPSHFGRFLAYGLSSARNCS